MSKRPKVWLLLGHRRGDNNQVLALGEALGVPFETRTMTYKWLARLRMKLFRTDIGHQMARAPPNEAVQDRYRAFEA